MGAVPPKVVAAVKVTEVPAQIVLLGDAVILTVGVTLFNSVIVIALLVSFVVLAHKGAVLMMRVTTSPFDNPFVVNVEAVDKVLTPFFFQR